MKESTTIVVTGATGQQGGATARTLLARGHRVRALTRDPSSARAVALAEAGATLHAGSFDDAGALRTALDGADGLFAVTTPFEHGPAAEVEQGRRLADAALDAGVEHVVYTSVASADRDTGIPHFDSKYAVEQYLARREVPHTVIAPVYFMENVYLPQTLEGIRGGVLAVPMPAGRFLQQVSVRDIGAFAALAFERRADLLGQRVELAGGELTGTHCAAALAALRQAPVEYVEAPLEQIRAVSDDLATMYAWFDRVGYQVDVGGLRSRFPEVAWHGYADWLIDQDPAAFAARA